MALSWNFDHVFNEAPGIACVVGSVTVDNYVQYVASPLAGEAVTALLNKFRGRKLKNICFHGDGVHEFTVVNEKLQLTVQASGSQPAAGTDTQTTFTAWGAA